MKCLWFRGNKKEIKRIRKRDKKETKQAYTWYNGTSKLTIGYTVAGVADK